MPSPTGNKKHTQVEVFDMSSCAVVTTFCSRCRAPDNKADKFANYLIREFVPFS